MNVADLDAPRRAAVKAALRPGETVRWIGLPDPSKSAESGRAGFTLAYVWLGIVGLWQAGALTAAIVSGRWEAWFYVAVGSVFLAIGLFFWWLAIRGRWRARNKLHLVTDQRVLSLDLVDPKETVEIGPDSIGYAEPVTRAGGHGDIEIGHGEPGVSAREASDFHHLRGVADVNGAIKALRLLVNDRGRSLVTEAPDD
jgi:hypothetical protein